MATFDIITAESFAEENLQSEGRKRQRYREAVSCLQCRQKKVKVYECILFHARILQSDQHRSVIEVFRAISAKSARSGRSAPLLRQSLHIHLKVKHPPASRKIDDPLRFILMPQNRGKIFKKTSIVMKLSCLVSILSAQTISQHHSTRAGRL